MPLGEILRKLMERRIDHYRVPYEDELSKSIELFLPSEKIESITVSPILLVTDRKPSSLVSIAYALRLACALNSDILAMTQGIHAEMIKKEAKELNIEVSLLESTQEQSIHQVLNTIQTHKVGLVIIPQRHELRNALQRNSPVSVLVTRASQFKRAG